jgi:hypothetical protein
MYSSTIQPLTSAVEHTVVGKGLGGLEKMGRVVGEEIESSASGVNENYLQNAQQQGKPLTFRNDRNPRHKMAASSIFPPKNN